MADEVLPIHSGGEKASGSVGGNCEPKRWKGALKSPGDKQEQEAAVIPRADIWRRWCNQSPGISLVGTGTTVKAA